MNLIRCRHCGSPDDRDLYMEDLYHDVTCPKCGSRTGKYGDENEAIDLWNGKGIKFYAVIFQSGLHGMMLELWDDKATADARAKYFTNMVASGTSVLGHKLDLSRGIRESIYVDTIEPNIKYEGIDKHGQRKP